jgi:hypothetical protein
MKEGMTLHFFLWYVLIRISNQACAWKGYQLMLGAIFVLFLLPVLIFLTSVFLYVLSGKEKGGNS